MKDTLNYLFAQNTLTREEAKDALIRIAGGEASEIEMAAFVSVFRMRKIDSSELAGFRDAMLELCIPVDLTGFDTIDVCGTGGDGKNTFNVSTIMAFVLAGAGLKVVKHGNYSVSSKCGSSNVMEHFGYKFSNEEDKIRKEIDAAGITYLHAPFFHPAMKNVANVRKTLQVKTFFNILGPMVNPAKPGSQLIGVFDEETMELYSAVFRTEGIKHAIVYSKDGYDEISLTSDFRLMTLDDDIIMSPSDLDLPRIKPDEIDGGNSVEEAADIVSAVLLNKSNEAYKNVIIANAALAINTFYPEKLLVDCIKMAEESLESGKASEKFNKLFEIQ